MNYQYLQNSHFLSLSQNKSISLFLFPLSPQISHSLLCSFYSFSIPVEYSFKSLNLAPIHPRYYCILYCFINHDTSRTKKLCSVLYKAYILKDMQKLLLNFIFIDFSSLTLNKLTFILHSLSFTTFYSPQHCYVY